MTDESRHETAGRQVTQKGAKNRMVTTLKLIRMTQRKQQGEVAGLLDISRSYYSMIESGRYVLLPDDPIRKRLEKTFNMSADELLSVVKIDSLAN